MDGWTVGWMDGWMDVIKCFFLNCDNYSFCPIITKKTEADFLNVALNIFGQFERKKYAISGAV